LNGHSDVVGGALIFKDAALRDRVAFLQNAVGAVISPMDSFLVLRGTKTLHVRMDRHEQNARALAAWLDSHPQVEKVIYPGLESHPQHALAKQQQRGFGGMISFVLRGNLDAARRFLSTCKLFTLAESLGERRIADRAPRDHDARERAARQPQEARHRRWLHPAQRRHRRRRRPAGRSRSRVQSSRVRQPW
jgi:cystathionine beta-lyase/cystathionine gamma-synthase